MALPTLYAFFATFSSPAVIFSIPPVTFCQLTPSPIRFSWLFMSLTLPAASSPEAPTCRMAISVSSRSPFAFARFCHIFW